MALRLIHIDTHIAVYLEQKRPRRISRDAAWLMREEPIAMSPLVVMELAYLSEIGRLDADAERIQAHLEKEFGITTSTALFADVCRTSIRQSWTRDPFDRLIVANAIVDGARLITADRVILENFKDAVW